jgi:TRAP-type C4-dicarboxylate transport system permease small subunit
LSAAPPQSWLARAAGIGRTIETALLAVLLGSLIVLGSAQIILRNLFSIGVNWSDPLTRLIVLWLALLGALAASRDGRHITMGALTQWLPKRAQAAAEVCADVFATIVAGALAWFAFEFVRDSREFGDTLLNDVPAWWLQSIMPVAFALIAYCYLVRAIAKARGG